MLQYTATILQPPLETPDLCPRDPRWLTVSQAADFTRRITLHPMASP